MNKKVLIKVVDKNYVSGIKIGVRTFGPGYDGKERTGFIDKEAHQRFVENIFETSPYDL